jgi:hypothetical protein
MAHAAAAIVMLHDALADASLLGVHARSNCRHDATWLVPGDNGRLGAQTERGRCAAGWSAIRLEVAAAEPRSLDLEHHFACPRRRIGEVLQFELAIAHKNDTFHESGSCLRISVA